MRTDTYTQFVLTIIALALVWLCVQNTVSPKIVSAQQQPQQAIGQGPGESLVIISGFVNTEQGLPSSVRRFTGNALPVRISK
jgi:hypothetical protein